MKIQDLKIILGPDGIRRRKFILVNRNTLSMEEFLSKDWTTNTITFNNTTLAQINIMLSRYNIRPCVFFPAYKKWTSYPILIFSQTEIRSQNE